MTSREIGFAVSHVSVKFKGNWTILFNLHCCRLQSKTLWSSSELIFLLSGRSFASVCSRETLALSQKRWKWCSWWLDCSHVGAAPGLRCFQVQEATRESSEAAAAGAVSAFNGYVAFVLTHWNTVRIYCHTRIIVTIVSKARVVWHDTSQNFTQPILTIKPKNTISKIGNGSPPAGGHVRSIWDDLLFLTCCYVSSALKLIL